MGSKSGVAGIGGKAQLFDTGILPLPQNYMWITPWVSGTGTAWPTRDRYQCSCKTAVKTYVKI